MAKKKTSRIIGYFAAAEVFFTLLYLGSASFGRLAASVSLGMILVALAILWVAKTFRGGPDVQ